MENYRSPASVEGILCSLVEAMTLPRFDGEEKAWGITSQQSGEGSIGSNMARFFPVAHLAEELEIISRGRPTSREGNNVIELQK